MEDRETPVLYLEMTEADARRLRRATGCATCSRCPGSSARRGGATSTATAPTCPRELPEFDTLGVYECAAVVRRARRRPTASPATTSCARRARARAGSPASPRCRSRSC